MVECNFSAAAPWYDGLAKVEPFAVTIGQSSAPSVFSIGSTFVGIVWCFLYLMMIIATNAIKMRPPMVEHTIIITSSDPRSLAVKKNEELTERSLCFHYRKQCSILNTRGINKSVIKKNKFILLSLQAFFVISHSPGDILGYSITVSSDM